MRPPHSRTHCKAIRSNIIITMRCEFEGTIEHESNQWLSSIGTPSIVSFCMYALSLKCWRVVGGVEWMRSPHSSDAKCRWHLLEYIFHFQYRHEYKRKSQTVRRKQLIPLISIDSTRMFSCIVLLLHIRSKHQRFHCCSAVLWAHFLFSIAMPSGPRMRQPFDGQHCVPGRICVFHWNIYDK